MENDWLCFVVGLQNWIDLGGDILVQFKANKSQFLEHVKHLFSTSPSSPISVNGETIAKSHSAPALEASRAKSGDAIDGYHPQNKKPPKPKTSFKEQVNNWNIDDVLDWLDKEQLAGVKEK